MIFSIKYEYLNFCHQKTTHITFYQMNNGTLAHKEDADKRN